MASECRLKHIIFHFSFWFTFSSTKWLRWKYFTWLHMYRLYQIAYCLRNGGEGKGRIEFRTQNVKKNKKNHEMLKNSNNKVVKYFLKSKQFNSHPPKMMTAMNMEDHRKIYTKWWKVSRPRKQYTWLLQQCKWKKSKVYAARFERRCMAQKDTKGHSHLPPYFVEVRGSQVSQIIHFWPFSVY